MYAVDLESVRDGETNHVPVYIQVYP